MSLSAALSAARSSLAANASETATVSRNIAGAGEDLFTRKSANRATVLGGVRIESISRADSPSLLGAMLGASSQAAGQRALVDGLDKLQATVGNPESDTSPAALLARLRDTVQSHAAAPDNVLMARAMLGAAGNVASALRTASGMVQQVRVEADADMAASVERINDLLARFEGVNTAIVNGTRAGDDVTARLDVRDRIMADLSEEIGLRVLRRPDNDIALYTDSGVTLFETSARAVTMAPTPAFQATTVGAAVFVDGVPVIGGGTTMQLATGRLAGFAELRDRVAPTYQGQLDEMARGLIEAFAESDQTGAAAVPDMPGLFTYPGAPAMPAGATLSTGLAAAIEVDANADPERGGSLERLRDGGIGDPLQPEYVSNATGASAFSGRLQELADAFARPRAFDPAIGIATDASLLDFANASVGWLEQARQGADAEIAYRSALLAHSSEALSNATGVNIDEEMTIMMELERSYHASAKLIATVDSMFAALFGAVR